MPFSESQHRRAAQVVIGLLGIGLAIALWPYATGLIGGPVLYVIFQPLHGWLVRRGLRPGLAAATVVTLAVVLILGPGVSVVGLVVSEAQEVAGGLVRSPVFGRLAELRIGDFEVGPRLVRLGETAVSWIGSSAFNILSAATRVALNLTIAMFGLYYLLVSPQGTWQSLAPYIPFNARNTLKLRRRFRDVTNSTLIGTGLIALIQGTLVGIAFAIVGLPSAFFWGVVTAVFAILPVVGSGLIWGPGAIALFLSGRYVAAAALLVVGAVIVGGVDNVIRPVVYNRWAKIHPIVTLVGALAGIRFFGLLGLLIGPLALSYFFELIAMYREEYIEDEDVAEEEIETDAVAQRGADGQAAAAAAGATSTDDGTPAA